jgi:2'-5' RNA ligase
MAEQTEASGGKDSRTCLKVLVRQRHLTYAGFCREWDRTAKSVDDGLVRHYPGRAQYYRWLRGELVHGRPYPDACRILEAMFPGWSVEKLFSPCAGNETGNASKVNAIDGESSNMRLSGMAAEGESLLSPGAGPEPNSVIAIGKTRPPSEVGQVNIEDAEDVLDRIQRMHNGTVDPDLVCQLQDNASETVAQYEKFDHASLVPALLKQRAFVDALLKDCGHPRQQQQLFEATGAISGVLGYVAVGRGDFRLARAYTLEAFQLADFAENANLQAWARGLQSFCEYYAGRYDAAVSLARDGLNYAQSGPQSIRLLINGVARAMGKLDDAEGVHRAVGEAYDLLTVNEVPEGVPSSISLQSYSAAQTASNAATAYVSLGMAEKVQYYVDLALPEISKAESPWGRSLLMIDRALSLARSKEADLDHATQLVLSALNISAGRPIISVQLRASEFVQYVITRWGDTPQARTVLDAISMLKVRLCTCQLTRRLPTFPSLEGPTPFRKIQRLHNHWARPTGPRSYYWYLTFEHSPELHEIARECQAAIAFPYYDLTPIRDLHLTLDRVAFDGDITPDQIDAIEDAAIRACRDMQPLDVTIGYLGGTAGAIGFNAYPACQIRDLRDTLRAATLSIYPGAPVGDPSFHPHVAIAYSNSDDVPTAEVIAVTEKLHATARVDVSISECTLVLVERRQRSYAWQVISRIPLTGGLRAAHRHLRARADAVSSIQ